MIGGTIEGMPTVEITHRMLPLDKVNLHLAEAGHPDGAPVVLLHGFPDAWFGWEMQIHALARQGFRVLAPDQRGYNRSSAPAAVSAYAITNLVRDVIALLDALDIPQVNLAGHDWGAAVAWHTALQHPDRVRRLAIANVPHPAVMRRFLRHSPRQMLKSWYIFFFQIPGLAEFLLEARDFNLAVRSLQRSGLPGTFAPDELERYRQSWKTAGGLRGMIHWYRAALRYPPPEPADPVLRMPVLILWGKRDIALHSAMAEASMAYCPQGRLVAFDDASHWVMRDRPAEVNRELSEHFGM